MDQFVDCMFLYGYMDAFKVDDHFQPKGLRCVVSLNFNLFLL